ncbi:MAG TPA: hemolysin family protein [Syntrophales bacterium]|nr:HlyC/CorC family transporter [Syntrophobacterales bacterium]HRR40489.1 hemolysin family protein [Syntrophales bacterium]HRT26526.1 hemolysin family protein [Syntrophales bacterium]HRT71547.1 hemolysin family protein [Syntrophales bacterium]
MTDHLLSILMVIFFLCLEGLFSGGEIALVASDINKVKQRAAAGSGSAAVVLRLLEKPEWFLATTVAGTDFCIIVNTALATSVFVSLFGSTEGGVVAVAVMIPVILLAAELIPKSIFQQRPESSAAKVAYFILLASWVLYPLVLAVAWISRAGIGLLTGGRAAYAPYITKEGLKHLLREQAGKGDIEPQEKEMVRRVFDFSDATVGQIMVPLSNVAALKETAQVGDAVTLIREKGFSRIPVYRESIFDITGILHSFDLLRALPEGEQKPVADYVRSAVFFVPETKSAYELFLEMQRRGEVMAVVVDEYGGAVGIITTEDLLEEVVGEIEDEYDKGERPYLKVGPGRYLFKAQTSLDCVREITRLEIPEGDYETLGGFILDRLGHIPRRRESVREGDVLFVVEDADAKSVKEVLIVLPDKKDGSESIA